jgi:hypothetical protein
MTLLDTKPVLTYMRSSACTNVPHMTSRNRKGETILGPRLIHSHTDLRCVRLGSGGLGRLT